MLSVTSVDKGDIVPITICIVYDSIASSRKLTSDTELTGSHNLDLLIKTGWSVFSRFFAENAGRG